jgi:GT2 family glycosyltransferase
MPTGLSIIICTKNRPADLEITLESVFSQRVLPDYLVIIDDGQAGYTRTILKKFDSVQEVRVVYIHPEIESSGLTAARNRGIRALPDLTGVILFLDDDVTLEENYLETLRNLFLKTPDLCGAGGFLRNPYHNFSLPVKIPLVLAGSLIPNLVPVSLFYPRVTRTAEALYPIFRKPFADAVPAQWLSGCNMAYRSNVFGEGALFDEHLIRYAQGEDMLFSHRLCQQKKRLLLSYDARITHRVSGESRSPPLRKLVMMFGYRNYEISRFIPGNRTSSFWYGIFVIQFILSCAILSIVTKKETTSVREAIRAYGMTREFTKEIMHGNLERFNDFLATLA